MASENQKVITFFHMSLPTVVRYSCKILEKPYSVPIQVVEVDKDACMSHNVISASDKEWKGKTTYWTGMDQSVFRDLLSKSKAFIIPDSFFSSKSMRYDTEEFRAHGLEPLVDYYKSGGTIVVFCVEGIYAIGTLLNQLFGTPQWKLKKVGNHHCIPSDKGRRLFGMDAQTVYAGKGHFMSAPSRQILYHIRSEDEEQFIEDCEVYSDDEDYQMKVAEARTKYRQYKTKNEECALLAVHEHEHGGRVIWMGDRNQEDVKMRDVFAKLICTGGGYRENGRRRGSMGSVSSTSSMR